MKRILLAFLLLASTAVMGQDYHTLVSEADGFYKAKDYPKSAEKYRQAFALQETNATDLYNAACAASQAGDEKLAFEWLNKAMKRGWTNVKHLSSDTDLAPLHKSVQWSELVKAMQKELDRKEANYDKPLQAILLNIFEDDQGIRRQFIEAQTKFGLQSKQVDSLGKIMLYKDSINLIKVTEILDKHGWVGPEKVGGQANQTLFLVIQHADLATQQKYLPMMREAVRNKKASPSGLALLEDRVALREGRKQIYGSQIGMDEKTQKHYVLPLEDPENVDKRRAEVGLEPIANYVKRWNVVWDVEEYKRELPELEAKQRQQH